VDFKGGNQMDRSVALVLEFDMTRPAVACRPLRVATLESLNARLLVYADNHTVLGWPKVQLEDAISFGAKVWILTVEPILDPMRLQVSRSQPERDGLPTDRGDDSAVHEMFCEEVNSPATQRVRRGAGGQSKHLLALTGFEDCWSTGAKKIVESLHPSLVESASPLANGLDIARQFLADLAVIQPICCQEHDPGTQDQALLSSGGPDNPVEFTPLPPEQLEPNRLQRVRQS
jgi:hypothetical protein